MNSSPLKAERERLGWSQNDLAKKLGVGLSTVGRWEQGKAVPYPYHLKKLATLLGKTPQQLGLLSDTDEQGEASPTALRSETATEVSLLADPAIPHTGSAKSPLARDGSLKPITCRLWPRSLRDRGLGSMSRGPRFRPLNPFSWHPALIGSTILLAVLLIVGVLPAFPRLPFLRGEEKQVSPPLPSNTHAQETFRPASYTLAIQNTDPSLNDTAQHLQNVFNGVYAQLVNRFALDRASVGNNTVTITFSSDLASAVQTSGSTITVNAHWLEQHPTQMGLLTHQLTLVVEHYPAGVPAWFADGLADYVRSVYGPADDDWSLPDGVQPHQSYTQGGPIAARFLRWAELHTRLDLVDQLHHALQRGQSFSAVLRRLTHETVDDLWSQYQAQPAITPTPEQRYTMATSRMPLYQASWELTESNNYKYAGPFLSNFAMQADITIVSGDTGAGFFFRNNPTNWYLVYLFASGYCRLDSIYQSRNHFGPWTFNSAIKPGLNQTNRLTIIVEKSSIYLYINAQFIAKVDDTHLLSYGTLGGVIWIHKSTAGISTRVQFDDVQIF